MVVEVHAILLLFIVREHVLAFAKGVVTTSILVLVVEYRRRDGCACRVMIASNGRVAVDVVYVIIRLQGGQRCD